MAEVRVKRIYEEASPEDGRRILVDRLWPRGVRKDRVDEWARDLAPSNELRREFHGQETEFEEFEARYVVELEDRSGELHELLDSTSGRLTLLFASKNLERNNATVLAEVLRRLEP